MLPINFEGSNIIMNKPSDMTDEQCMPLHAYKGVDEEGFPFFLECWKPSKEDIEAIQSGQPIWIKIVSNGLPPIAVFTTDDKNEIN